MENEEKSTQFLIPANVSAKYEIFKGISFKELKLIMIAGVVGVALFMFTGIFQRTVYEAPNNIIMTGETELNENGQIEISKPVVELPLRAMCLFLPVVGMFFAVRKEEATGLSILDSIISFQKFKKTQNKYLYKYKSGTEGVK